MPLPDYLVRANPTFGQFFTGPTRHSMYSTLLALHSAVRWLVLATLLYALFRAGRGWLGARVFSTWDDTVRRGTAGIAQVQLGLGLWLYGISPIVAYFLGHFREAVHERQLRFFGMEHSSVMLTAVLLLSIGSSKAKRQTGDRAKFRTLALWYGIALLLILSSVPWPFSPLVSRPAFRGF